MKRLLIPFGGLLFLISAEAAELKKQEPFEDVLREAVKHYRAGKIDEAGEELAKAAKLIDDMRAAKVVNTFPDAPKGWTVGALEKSEIPQVMGGGRSVKKTYREKDGKKTVVLEVIYDSSFTKLMIGLLANDAVAESQGFKIRKIGGDRGLLKESADGGELNLLVDDRTLVKLTGTGGAKESDLAALARDVDSNALKKN